MRRSTASGVGYSRPTVEEMRQALMDIGENLPSTVSPMQIRALFERVIGVTPSHAGESAVNKGKNQDAKDSGVSAPWKAREIPINFAVSSDEENSVDEQAAAAAKFKLAVKERVTPTLQMENSIESSTPNLLEKPVDDEKQQATINEGAIRTTLVKLLSELSVPKQDIGVKCTFQDIENAVEAFTGDDGFRVQQWIEDFEAICDDFAVSDRSRLVFARRLIKSGPARDLIRSGRFKTWAELREALRDEFGQELTVREILDKMRTRKKTSNETCHQYVLAMQALVSGYPIPEEDVICAILEGLQDKSTNISILAGCNTIDDLKRNLRRYERQLMSATPAVQRIEKLPVKSTANAQEIRCYNCSERGHFSSECSKPRSERDTCFKCKKAGHQIKQCPLYKTKGAAGVSAAAEESNEAGISSDDVTYDVKVFQKPNQYDPEI
ncbi:uncharacterized protein LOC129802744 [Phlebotomus papatasi]|uniref:uncharacterized protein LOC129802158 n=1 Tax=Phlebotomus papatasi TaxID=29031 RepID=UPI002483B1A1|nr:uncharacterized protein LOC129802158 [Phlebotomus papatasi]XP_055704766.1 uncharacterized protein LOC129802744 [Phlebotomus papatasi]